MINPHLFDNAARPAPLRTLAALWASGREAWNMVFITLFTDSLETFAEAWVTRKDYKFIQKLLPGLEAYVRRALLLAAYALAPQTTPQPAPRTSRPKPARRIGILAGSFKIFSRPTRSDRSAGRKIYARDPEPTPDWMSPKHLRHHRWFEQEFKLANLAADPLERPPAETSAAALAARPPANRPYRLRSERVTRPPLSVKPGRGIALRMAALKRVLSDPDRYARRLRSRLDRDRVMRAREPGRPAPRLAPYPRDRFFRRAYLHGEMTAIWPGIEADVQAALNSS